MSLDPASHLAAATQRRVADTRARARAALRRLDRDGAAINFVAVASAADVSRSLLYRDPELRDEINRLRSTSPSTTARAPASQRMTQGSRDELLRTLRDEVAALRKENQALRARLSETLGEHRHAGPAARR